MSLLTITDAAYLEIARTVRESAAEDAVIALSQITADDSPDGLERMVMRGASEEALKVSGLYEHRFELTPVRWRLEAGCLSGETFPWIAWWKSAECGFLLTRRGKPRSREVSSIGRRAISF
jgi:hypothetical protein